MCFKKVFFLFFMCFETYAYECCYEDYYKAGSIKLEEDCYDPEYITKKDMSNSYFKKENTLSINSAYFGQQASSQQLTDLGIELINISNHFIQNISPDNMGGKIFACGVSLYCTTIYGLAIHEMGHGLRTRAFGAGFDLCTANEEDSESTKRREDFLSYYLRCLATMSFTASTTEYTRDQDPYESLVISAAGVNNEMLFAEKIAEAKQQGKLDDNWITDVNYYYNKLPPLLYAQSAKESSTDSSHDINAVLKAYKELNLDVKKSHIRTAYIVSLLGGALSDNVFKLARQYDEENPILRKINAPDVFVYLTSYGVSYKFTTGYALNDLTTLKLGLELVMHGKRKQEISLGFIKRFKNYYKPEISGTLFFGCEGVNLEFSGSVLIKNRFRLKGGYGMYTAGSLHGERHAKSIYKISERVAADNARTVYKKNTKKKSNHFWIGISYVF